MTSVECNWERTESSLNGASSRLSSIDLFGDSKSNSSQTVKRKIVPGSDLISQPPISARSCDVTKLSSSRSQTTSIFSEQSLSSKNKGTGSQRSNDNLVRHKAPFRNYTNIPNKSRKNPNNKSTSSRISTSQSNRLPLESAVDNECHKDVTIKDLCPDDKARIISLVDELAALTEKNEKTVSTLNQERDAYNKEKQELLAERRKLEEEKELIERHLQRSQEELLQLQAQLLANRNLQMQQQSISCLVPSVPPSHNQGYCAAVHERMPITSLSKDHIETNQSNNNASADRNLNEDLRICLPSLSSIQSDAKSTLDTPRSAQPVRSSVYQFNHPPLPDFNPLNHNQMEIHARLESDPLLRQGNDKKNLTNENKELQSLESAYQECIKKLSHIAEEQHRLSDPKSWPAPEVDQRSTPHNCVTNNKSNIDSHSHSREISATASLHQDLMLQEKHYQNSRRELIQRQNFLLEEERRCLNEVLGQQQELKTLSNRLSSLSSFKTRKESSESSCYRHKNDNSTPKNQISHESQRQGHYVLPKRLNPDDLSVNSLHQKDTFPPANEDHRKLSSSPISDSSRTPSSLRDSITLPPMGSPSIPSKGLIENRHQQMRLLENSSRQSFTGPISIQSEAVKPSDYQINRPLPQSYHTKYHNESPSSSILDIVESMELKCDNNQDSEFTDPQNDLDSDEAESQIIEDLFFCKN